VNYIANGGLFFDKKNSLREAAKIWKQSRGIGFELLSVQRVKRQHLFMHLYFL